MTHLDLKISRDVLGEASLRADGIRRSTLVQLALALQGDHATDVRDALDDLIEAVTSPREGEIDALIDDLETHADMGPAVMPLSQADVAQLRDQAAAAVRPVRAVTNQQERSAA